MRKVKIFNKKRLNIKIVIYIILISIVVIFVIHTFTNNKINDKSNVISNTKTYHKTDKVPENYYFTKCNKYNSNYDDLSEVLREIKMPFRYERGVYDCSQLGSFVEWYLRAFCFNAVISVNFSEYHAWVTVYDIDGYPDGITIEAATDQPTIVVINENKYISEVELNAYGVTKMLSNYTFVLQGIDDSNGYYRASKIINNNKLDYVFSKVPRGNYTTLLLNHNGVIIKNSELKYNITIDENDTDIYGDISYMKEFQWWNTNLTDKYMVVIT